MDDDLRKQLERLGIKPGSWKDNPGGPAKSAFLDKQVAILAKIRDLLQAQLNKDVAEVAELQEKVDRLKHGGGA